MASILETPRRNQDAPKSRLHGTSTQGSMRERICHPLSSFSGGTFCTVTLSELGPRSSRSPTCPVLAERAPKHLGRTSHLRGGIHRLPTRLGARKHRGGQRRGPRAERAAAAGEGGPVVARGPLSSAALLPLTAPPSPRHGAPVFPEVRGEQTRGLSPRFCDGAKTENCWFISSQVGPTSSPRR